MSSPRSPGPSRRRQRSVRVTVAVCLLAAAALLVAVALALSSLPVTSAAAVVALLCGFASTRILINELAQSRRDAARDRAEQAHAYQRTYAERVAEHDRFATTMTERLIERDAQIVRLLGSIRLADRRADEAEKTAKRELQRNAELRRRLDDASRALAKSTALWDGDDASAVADLLAWEERVAAASSSRPEERRTA